MNKSTLITIAILVAGGFLAQDVLARGGGRGGGGGGGRGGGMSYHGGGAAQRSPSMSRPQPSRAAVQKPSRPPSHHAASRPSTPAKKPSPPKQQMATRPGTGAHPGTRPGGGPGDRTSKPSPPRQQVAGRPGTAPHPGARPGTGPGDRTGRPTQAQVQQFLNLPQGPKGGIGSDIAKIGAGVAAGALGAEGARRLLEGHQPGGLERPAQLPARPEAGDRPGVGDRPGERPGTGDRPGIGDRPGDRPGIAGRPGERPGVGDRPIRPDRPSQLPAKEVGNQIRDNMHNRYDNAFTRDWWRDHPHAAHAYWDKHHHPWHHWWRPATWGVIGGWAAGAAFGGYGEPVYYDYGDTIYYEGDNVYVNGQQTATAEEYYQQAGNLATSAPPPSATDQQADDWLPLGVFALSQGNVTYSNMLLQLALNKDGAIAGTFYNTTTDAARPIKGMVDKKTQRAAWTFADGKNTDIIMETGLYNLTLDQAEALIHFGKDNTQQWLMVRLNEPDDKKKTDGGKSS